MNEERFLAVASVAVTVAAIGLVVGGVGVVIAAFRFNLDDAALWFTIAVQGATAAFGIVGAIAFAVWSFVQLSRKIDDLKTHHEAGLETVAKRTPTGVAAMILAAEVLKILADKSFREDVISTISVSVLLFLGFALANQFLVTGHRLVGVGVWILSALTYPLFALWNRQWNVNELLSDLQEVELSTQMFFALAAIVLVFLPLLFLLQRNSET